MSGTNYRGAKKLRVPGLPQRENYSFQAFLYTQERMKEMGGCGGKKSREKAKQQAATIDSNFNSTGDVNDQAANRELVVRLFAEVLPYVDLLDSNDRLFLQDCRIKMNMYGSRVVFGWRQVAKIVAIHKWVKGVEDANAKGGIPQPDGQKAEQSADEEQG